MLYYICIHFKYKTNIYILVSQNYQLKYIACCVCFPSQFLCDSDDTVTFQLNQYTRTLFCDFTRWTDIANLCCLFDCDGSSMLSIFLVIQNFPAQFYYVQKETIFSLTLIKKQMSFNTTVTCHRITPKVMKNSRQKSTITKTQKNNEIKNVKLKQQLCKSVQQNKCKCWNKETYVNLYLQPIQMIRSLLGTHVKMFRWLFDWIKKLVHKKMWVLIL